MLKILNIISDRNIGGAGRCILNFLKYYDRKKFAVKVVVPRGSLLKPEIEKLKTKVIEVDGIADKSFDRKAIGKLNRIIKKENPDIVHTHGTVTGRISGKLCGKKVVYTRHSVFPVSPSIKKGLGRMLNKYLNEFLADDIIAVAEAAKENLTEGGIAPEKIKVILNGVEPLQKASQQEMASMKEKYHISQKDFVIGILARLDAVKGHQYLIEAAQELKKEGRAFKVLIAGTGENEQTLKALVKYCNIYRISFRGKSIFEHTGYTGKCLLWYRSDQPCSFGRNEYWSAGCCKQLWGQSWCNHSWRKWISF